MPTLPPPIRYEPAERNLVVDSIEQLTPSMVRVTFTGSDLEGFRTDGPHDHVKLGVGSKESGEPLWRDYTIRRFDASRGTLEIDFVVHGHGPASEWADQAQVGDTVTIRGPRGSRPMPVAEHYILIGDGSSLPAIGRWLEQLPPSATGSAFIAVHDDQDEVDLFTDAQVTIEWLHAGDVDVPGAVLAETVSNLEVPDSDHFVWAAGEVSAIRAVRDVLIERGFSRDNLSLSGYWRHGRAGHDHHAPLDAD